MSLVIRRAKDMAVSIIIENSPLHKFFATRLLLCGPEKFNKEKEKLP